MTWQDRVVHGREWLLGRLLGFAPDEVLNGPGHPPMPPAETSPASTGPALLRRELSRTGAALKQAVNALKAEGMDEAGRHVDYARLRHSPAYLAYRTQLTPRLRQLDLATLTTRAQQLAFWINLYNALILDAAIAFQVQASVTEGRAGVFSFFRRAAYTIGGQRFSANDIEHGILRANHAHWAIPGPQFGPSDPRLKWRVLPLDPRIHFALNCASRSCPPIGVYDADRIEEQLDLAAAAFVAGEVKVDVTAGVITLSSIFKWYAADFGGRAGVLALLQRHAPDPATRAWLTTHGAAARWAYHPYDWGLNT